MMKIERRYHSLLLKKVFIEDLPKYESGNQKGKINWTECIGCKVKFVFESKKTKINKTIRGIMTIVGYNIKKQKLLVEYQNKTYNILTCDFRECKIAKIIKNDIYRYPIDKTKSKWIDFSNAPLNGKGIDWKQLISNNIKLPFRYNDIFGEFEIKDMLPNRHLIVKCLDHPDFEIFINNFLKFRFGGILETINYKYIYKVDDIVEGRYSNIQIIKQLRKKASSGLNVKWYKYKCLKCGYIHDIAETALLNGTGCPVCANKKVFVGYNDIPTTDPWMVKFFQGGYDEAKLYTSHSGKSIYPICPDCGRIKDKPMIISNLKRTKSIGCSCADGISFPEKFMIELLNQLNTNFVYRKTFLWSNHKEYDFYIPDKQTIIETNGEQHYDKTFDSVGGRTLLEEKNNDKLKKDLAKQNGIVNYIIIDCRKSELEWIQNSILHSKLVELFDCSNIDWHKCEEQGYRNIIKEVCEIKKNNQNYSTIEIGKIVGLSYGTIIRYLKIGNKLNWCVYNKEQSVKIRSLKRIGKNHPMAKKIICLTTGEIFNTETDAANTYKLNVSHLSSCCTGKRKTCGKHPITGEKLRWSFVEKECA